MPKKVDRGERRQEIVRTYLRVATRDGMEAATSRALAEELGVATGALWHYFNGFDEVLQGALRHIVEYTNERSARRVEGLRGLRALTEMLHEILPLDSLTRDEAHVVVSFWGRVPSRPDLADIQSEIVRQWHHEFHHLLTQAIGAGELHENAPLEALSDALIAYSTGLQVEVVLRTPLAQTARQWRLIHLVLAPWMTRRGESVSGLRELIDPVVAGHGTPSP